MSRSLGDGPFKNEWVPKGESLTTLFQERAQRWNKDDWRDPAA